VKKFLVHQNLSGLCGWLRFLGYNVKTYQALSVGKIISLCRSQKRTLLTKSKKEAKLFKNSLLIPSKSPQEQLESLKNYLVLDKTRLFTVCPKCNSLLQNIDRQKVQKSVPKYIYQTYQNFRICFSCGGIFWQGSQYRQIHDALLAIFDRKDKKVDIKDI